MEDSLILLLITKKQINMFSFIMWLNGKIDRSYEYYKKTSKDFRFSKELLTEYEYQNFLLYLYRKGLIQI